MWKQERTTENLQQLLALLHSATARLYYLFCLTATLEMPADNS